MEKLDVIDTNTALYVEMKAQQDFEEITIVEKNRVGNPTKCVVFQSKSVGKKIVVVPIYFKIKKGEIVLGYKEWKAETFVIDYDEPVEFKFSIFAENQINNINEIL